MNNAKETIRAKLSIESVVGSYIKLEPSGKNFRACCPFHHEKSPSFYVTPSLGIYKCFGCHKGGDIFKFVEEIENIPFYEALKSLAEKAGVSLRKSRQRKTKSSQYLATDYGRCNQVL
jgi:DNA primase